MNRRSGLSGSLAGTMIIGFVVFTALIAVQGYFYLSQKNHMQQVGEIVAHSERVIDKTNEIVKAISEGIYNGSVPADKDMAFAFRDLHGIVGDDAKQKSQVRALEAETKRHFQEIGQDITGRKSYDALSTEDRIRRNSRLYELRRIADQIMAWERKSLRKYRPASQEAEEDLINTLVIAVGMTYVVLLTTILACVMALMRVRWAEGRLRSKELDFRAAADGSMSAFLLFRKTHRNSGFVLEYFNPAAQRMWKGIAPITNGHEIGNIFPYINGDPKQVTEYFHQIAQSGKARESEYKVSEKFGIGRYFMHQVTVLPNGLAITCRDITERKQIERMKNEFVSIVSHELRTPLTSIRGSLGLIMGGIAGGLPDQAQNLLTIAYNNCERLVRLINDILDIEKIESGRMHFDYRPVDVSTILTQAIEANQSYAEKYGIVFRCIPPQKDMRVIADSDRLMQVLTNLLSNAAKFSPKGSDVVLTATEEGGGLVRFAVSDAGPGIPKEFQEHIFEKFSQADGSDSRQKGGTGLGLSIVKAIVEEMKGAVGFSTEKGKGTTFYFTLFKAQQDNLVTLTTAKRATQNILICEDDTDIARLLKMIFEKMGLEADVALTAAQADSFLRNRTYMAMTLDLQLPDRDGITFIRDLRENPDYRQMPIVVISVKAEDGRRQIEGEAFGIVDWLSKPIDVTRLSYIVQDLRAHDHTPRILHVEDDPDIVEVLRLSLAETADVTATARLEEAKTLVQKNEYDLVILDIGLPDGVGTDLLPYLGSRAAQPVPVLLFTASDVPADIIPRVTAALVKSRTSEEALLRTIRRIIGRGDEKKTGMEAA